ncbi:hypothetical protein LO771_00435 [Streptacidiphilus sp. ASG 303]|uniref:hypothetical protein n=1 Tax=Streptacidiphilus sp. ASG 303 TaxID=2896847 RepID=UPI001E44E91C|nr:hypothetical protein [Streptacidiphilus sp. ASG 303]MCD0480920.1 hypothetical protein [Streptacidiphilus sp. ASG 303]
MPEPGPPPDPAPDPDPGPARLGLEPARITGAPPAPGSAPPAPPARRPARPPAPPPPAVPRRSPAVPAPGRPTAVPPASGVDAPPARPRTAVTAVVGAAAVAVAGTAFCLLAAEPPERAAPAPARGTRPLPASPAAAAVPVPPQAAGGVAAVVLDGVSGEVLIGSGPRTSAVTGTVAADRGTQPRWEERAGPGGGRALHLSCRTAGGRVPVPCAGRISLTVPDGTAVRLLRLSGRAVLTGLAGDVDLSAASADVRAAGLRSARLTAEIASGSMDLAFAAPPARVALSAASSHAAVHLPGCAAYAVSSQGTRASVDSRLRRDNASPHLVEVGADSSDVQLLPDAPAPGPC